MTNLDIEMFHDDSWKPIGFGVKRSRRTKQVRVGLQTEHSIAVCCVRKLRWVLKIFAVCRDAARRAGSSATAELLVVTGAGGGRRDSIWEHQVAGFGPRDRHIPAKL